MTKKQTIGIDWEGATVEAYCHNHRWKIKPATKLTVDKLYVIADEYEKKIKKIGDANGLSHEHLKIWEEATKKILEMCLEGFKYKKYENDPKANPAMLGHLANAVRDFLVLGGRDGMEYQALRLENLKKLR